MNDRNHAALGISRRDWLCEVFALAVLARPSHTQAAPAALTPEQFGAAGDGRSNDTKAFAALSAAIAHRGGGEVVLRPTVYVVGHQVRRGEPGYAFSPVPILRFSGLTESLAIRGNGACLRAAPGLRYGIFDPLTGRPVAHALPYYGSRDPSAPDLASPYFAMIDIEDCAGDIEIADIELDGNDQAMNVGGPYGDTGWQIGCGGMRLRRNRGNERLSRIKVHHHLQDGLTIDGDLLRRGASVIEEVRSEHNGRQGCSVVGGRRYVFVDCRFNHTGKGRLMSQPGAGVDIEAEGTKVREIVFRKCEFSDNAGAGMIADSGDSEGVTFDQCRFIGTTSWAAWPRKPRFAFRSCEFVGAIVGAYGDKDPARATHFSDCRFRDDPALSPTRKVYLAEGLRTIAELPYSRNTRFERCRFELTGSGVLPWSVNDVIYADCRMTQRSSKQSYPRGTFLGRNRIDANVDLSSSKVIGELIVNGKRWR